MLPYVKYRIFLVWEREGIEGYCLNTHLIIFLFLHSFAPIMNKCVIQAVLPNALVLACV